MRHWMCCSCTRGRGNHSDEVWVQRSRLTCALLWIVHVKEGPIPPPTRRAVPPPLYTNTCLHSGEGVICIWVDSGGRERSTSTVEESPGGRHSLGGRCSWQTHPRQLRQHSAGREHVHKSCRQRRSHGDPMHVHTRPGRELNASFSHEIRARLNLFICRTAHLVQKIHVVW